MQRLFIIIYKLSIIKSISNVINVKKMDETTFADYKYEESEKISQYEGTINYESFKAPISIHAICVPLIMMFIITGNTFVIYIYSKQKPLTVGNVFVIYLAIIDNCAAIYVTQFPFVYYYVTQPIGGKHYLRSLFFALFAWFVLMYLGILMVIALDRVWAVYKPYSYSQSTTRTLIVITLVTIICLILSSLIFVGEGETSDGRVVKPILVVYISTSFITIVVSYAAIAIKLRKQKSKVRSTTYVNRAAKEKPGNCERLVKLYIYSFSVDRLFICILLILLFMKIYK